MTQQPKNHNSNYHVPVMLDDVLYWLLVDVDGTYVDCTVGGGAHARALLARLSPKGRLIGIDLDEEALARSRETLKPWANQVILKKGNFRELGEILQELGIDVVDGILMDLGVSSHQIDADYRGFSFMRQGPLDMRMNRDQKVGAFHVVNTYPEAELRRIFFEYGEERRSAAIARKIVQERAKSRIDSTTRLAEIVAGAVPREHLNKSLARIFQAIRIEVNAELLNLRLGLEAAVEHMRVGGRLVVISYHSLEDRIVKNFFRASEGRCICPPELPKCICNQVGKLKVLTKRPITPSVGEIKRNPRARSAKLRVAERI